ncbi:MAG: hypothetical protein WBW73_13935 [Rhodoplanes sp.]
MTNRTEDFEKAWIDRLTRNLKRDCAAELEKAWGGLTMEKIRAAEAEFMRFIKLYDPEAYDRTEAELARFDAAEREKREEEEAFEANFTADDE